MKGPAVKPFAQGPLPGTTPGPSRPRGPSLCPLLVMRGPPGSPQLLQRAGPGLQLAAIRGRNIVSSCPIYAPTPPRAWPCAWPCAWRRTTPLIDSAARPSACPLQLSLSQIKKTLNSVVNRLMIILLKTRNNCESLGKQMCTTHQSH